MSVNRFLVHFGHILWNCKPEIWKVKFWGEKMGFGPLFHYYNIRMNYWLWSIGIVEVHDVNARHKAPAGGCCAQCPPGRR